MNMIEQIIDALLALPRYNIGPFNKGCCGKMCELRELSESGQWIDADDIAQLIEKFRSDEKRS